ncbi:MAG: glycoside hydrolase family 3 C-terminal domain-containing protein, partial [Clostridia bacterium]|nr:glycoside hydrolase family 3 C-terminal domain-containing protein [Clostridia bacterium]
RDPRWGRGQETYGEDPTLTARLGRAFVRGLQGKGETLKTAACAKHFAAHSGPEALRHGFDARVSEKDLEETYLVAFHELVDEGVEAVMGAYNRLNGEPCCASSYLMEKLRGEWGFQGHFVSDCWAIRDFHENHGVTAAPTESVQLALRSGCDLNCGCTYQHILRAMELGMISDEEVTRSAVRLFTTRFLLGVLGEEGSEYDSLPYELIECPESLDLAQKAARTSCVLLKNSGLLPLDPDSCGTIGVIGPNANSRSALVGNYHGTASRYVTVLEGIQNYVGDRCRVLYSQGCALWADRVEPLAQPNDRLAEAIAVAKTSDTVILVLGLDETLEGEEGDTGNSYSSGDKEDLFLPETQRILLDGVLAVGKPTVVILLAGSAIDLSEAQEKADAILLGWYPGAVGGRAVAELLFGEVSPSGKLPVTFYRNEALSDMPAFTDYAMSGRTYRYYRGEPLYPFGYGLSYGDCEVIALSADRTNAVVSMVNRGPRDTEEVIQLYLRDEDSPFAPPNPILCGFKRFFLAAGVQKTLSVPLDEKAFTVVTDTGDRIPGSGRWTLYAGFGGPDKRTEALTGRKARAVPIRTPQ